MFCYDEQNRMVWAGNNNTQQPTSCASNGTPANTFFGATYHSVYTYNNLGQITSGPYNGTGTAQQYLYCDSNHPHALTLVAALNSTCSIPTGTEYSASYDAHGNMTSRAPKSGSSLDTQSLSFDGQDHLVRWNDTVTPSNEEWYMYDASGTRVLQRSTTGSGTSNTSITVYAFGLEEHVYNGSGTLTSSKYYYSLGGRLIGKTSGSGAPTFFLTDLLGSVLANFSGVSGTSAVAGNQTFGPYGNLQYFKGSMGTLKGFTGQYTDDLSGLHNFGARSYDQLVGTFLSADTVQGNMQGDDPYAYVAGNPETLSDPTGRLIVSSCYLQGCSQHAVPAVQDTGTARFVALSGNFTDYTQTHPAIDTTTACTKASCQVTVLLNTGSVGVPYGSTSGCALGSSISGFSPCIPVAGPSGYSLVDTSTPIRFCPSGCPEESDTGDAEDGATSGKTDGLLFADTGDELPQARPKVTPTEETQAAAGEAGNKKSFPNTMPANLSSELASAKKLGVKPAQVGDTNFDTIINSGRVKWAVTEAEELFIVPEYVNQQEIAHSVLTNGAPVLAAGRANIAGSDGVYLLLDIDTYSGHYIPSQESLQIGINAFTNNGILFGG